MTQPGRSGRIDSGPFRGYTQPVRPRRDIDKQEILIALKAEGGRIKAAARRLEIPSATLGDHISRLGIRDEAREIRERAGQDRGRPRHRDLTPRRALSAWKKAGSLNAAARALKCHPDKLLARLEDATRAERAELGDMGVREYLRVVQDLEKVLGSWSPDAPTAAQVHEVLSDIGHDLPESWVERQLTARLRSAMPKAPVDSNLAAISDPSQTPHVDA